MRQATVNKLLQVIENTSGNAAFSVLVTGTFVITIMLLTIMINFYSSYVTQNILSLLHNECSCLFGIYTHHPLGTHVHLHMHLIT